MKTKKTELKKIKLSKSEEWMLVLAHLLSDAWIDKKNRDKIFANDQDIFKKYNYQLPAHITITFERDNISNEHDYTQNAFSAFDTQNLTTHYTIKLFIPENAEDIAQHFTLHDSEPTVSVQCMCTCL